MKTLNFFKRFCGAALVLVAMAAPMLTSCYDDSALNEKLEAVQNEVDQIKTDLTQLKSDLAALKAAVDANLSVSQLNQLPDGYELVFSDGTKAVIKNGTSSVVGANEDEDGVLYWTLNGEWLLDADGNKIKASAEDGETPQVALTLDETDGYYYWTVNGEWLLDAEGNKVRANGIDGKEPVIKMYKSDSEGVWVWNVNGEILKDQNGEVINAQGPAGLGGLNGDAFFESVELSQDGTKLIITLLPEKEGEDKIVYEIPMGAFDIVFDAASAEGVTTDVKKFSYTVSGVSAGDKVIVRVLSTNATGVKVVPESATKGYVELELPSGEGYADIYALNNTTGDLKAKSLKLKGQDFSIDQEVETALHFSPVEANEVTIPLTTGVEYEIRLSNNGEDWLDVTKEPRTKAVSYENLILKADPNNSGAHRKTTLTIKKKGAETVFAEFTVEQKNIYEDLLGLSLKETWKYVGNVEDAQDDSEYKDQTGVLKIELSDDFSKGVYKVSGFLTFANQYNAGGSATLYADVEGNTMTFHGEKNAHSYFGLSLVSDFVCSLNAEKTSITKEGVTVIASILVCKDYSASVITSSGDDELAKIAGIYNESYSTVHGYSASSYAGGLVISLENGALEITKILSTSLTTSMSAVYEDGKLITTGGRNDNTWGPADLTSMTFDVTIEGDNVELTPTGSSDLILQAGFYTTKFCYGYKATRQ